MFNRSPAGKHLPNFKVDKIVQLHFMTTPNNISPSFCCCMCKFLLQIMQFFEEDSIVSRACIFSPGISFNTQLTIT